MVSVSYCLYTGMHIINKFGGMGKGITCTSCDLSKGTKRWDSTTSWAVRRSRIRTMGQSQLEGQDNSGLPANTNYKHFARVAIIRDDGPVILGRNELSSP